MQATLSQLLHIHQMIDPIDDIISLCQRSCELLAQVLHLPDQVLYLNNTNNQLQQVAAAGAKFAPGTGVLSPLCLAHGEGVVGQAALHARSLCITDTRLIPNYVCDDASRSAELSVPIVYQGEIIGVLDAEHAQAGFFGQAQQQFTEAFAAILGPRLANLIVRPRMTSRQPFFSAGSRGEQQHSIVAENWLTQAEFNSTLLQALKHFYTHRRWQRLPLQRLALLQQTKANTALAQGALKHQLVEAIAVMRQHTATALWGNISHARYIDKQDQLSLADQQYMAFSTLRRHQQLAQQHLLQQLWQMELLLR